MNKFDFKKIIEWLNQILRCPVCGYRYSLEQTKIIDSKDEKNGSNASLLIHTDCDRCKSSVVFNIAVDGPEIFTMGVPTDLTADDTSKFKNSAPIGSDEVLATYQFLQSFDGDFREALK
jgi:hypothetical protein